MGRLRLHEVARSRGDNRSSHKWVQRLEQLHQFRDRRRNWRQKETPNHPCTWPHASARTEYSTKVLAYTTWSDKQSLARAMADLELEHSEQAVQEIVDALTPYEITAARYGYGETWYNFTGPHLSELAAKIENRKQGVVVSNELMNGADPCYGARKQLEVTVRRLALTNTLLFNEGVVIKRSDLWLS